MKALVGNGFEELKHKVKNRKESTLKSRSTSGAGLPLHRAAGARRRRKRGNTASCRVSSSPEPRGIGPLLPPRARAEPPGHGLQPAACQRRGEHRRDLAGGLSHEEAAAACGEEAPAKWAEKSSVMSLKSS
ncbi:unnamed protein product [Caretta caretta]